MYLPDINFKNLTFFSKFQDFKKFENVDIWKNKKN